MLRCSEAMDWMIRTYQRETVVNVLAKAREGNLYLLGKRWQDYPGIQYPNVHVVDGWVTYVRTLEITTDAGISLNVMPWFNVGIYDRIFNAFLQHSVLLTDTSGGLERV